MLLTPQDVELFFKLHRALMFFVNQRLKVLADEVVSPDEFSSLSPEIRLKVRDAFLKHTDLIEAFADENPAHLTDDELDIVRSWRHLVHGKFYVFRQLKKYMVFLSTSQQPVAYGVLALSQPFEELVGPYLPVLTETVLLPFQGMIVYDGLMSSYRISFGPGIRRSLNESFKEAKARHGIITSLTMSDEPLPRRAPKAKSRPRKKTKETNPFTGRWRIVSMSAWDEDYIDEEEEGFFEFDDKESGEFHFGYVHGHMDCRLTMRDGETAVEWAWDGNDEMDPAQGRGWAVVNGDEPHGMIFFHGGDDSEFVAKKKKPKRQR